MTICAAAARESRLLPKGTEEENGRPRGLEPAPLGLTKPTLRQNDAAALPFEDNTFDVLLAMEALRHFLDYHRFLGGWGLAERLSPLQDESRILV